MAPVRESRGNASTYRHQLEARPGSRGPPRAIIDAVSPDLPSWEPLSDAVLADQLGAFDRMRSACPAAVSPRGVTLFRHRDVVDAANDPQRFSSVTTAHRSIPNAVDPPDHARWRVLIDQFFVPARLADLEPRVRAIADTLVESLPRRATIDAVAEIGRPLAVRAQTDWLGWQGTEDRLLVWMAENHAATRSRDRLRTSAVAEAFDEIVSEQVERRRRLGDAAPDDPTTELVRAFHDGRPLEDAEIVSILRNWTAGDLGSMAAALGVVVQFLVTNPDVQAELRDDPSGLALAVDEMLRIDDPFLANRRVTTEAVRIGDHELPAGTRVYLNWTSANRDEAVFGDPDAYRPADHAPTTSSTASGSTLAPADHWRRWSSSSPLRHSSPPRAASSSRPMPRRSGRPTRWAVGAPSRFGCAERPPATSADGHDLVDVGRAEALIGTDPTGRGRWFSGRRRQLRVSGGARSLPSTRSRTGAWPSRP